MDGTFSQSTDRAGALVDVLEGGHHPNVGPGGRREDPVYIEGCTGGLCEDTRCYDQEECCQGDADALEGFHTRISGAGTELV
jgi:hypothetical protein